MNGGGAGGGRSRQLTFWVTSASVLAALLLSAIKLLGWWRDGSVALLASLADSALDLVAALATFVAVRVAAAPPDLEHRFGHGKAEAFSSLLQAGLVFATAALVGEEAVRRLLSLGSLPDESGALGIMALSLAVTGALVAAQSYVLARTPSPAVRGDRAHYAADLAANLAAFVGIGLARMTGQGAFDAVAGLVVALWLVLGAVAVFKDAADHLLDRELRGAERQAIVDCVLADPAVRGIHDLRTRAVGASIHMQMHLDLDPYLSLADAHLIVEAAERRLGDRFPNADVFIHPDPAGLAEPVGPFGEETASTARGASPAGGPRP